MFHVIIQLDKLLPVDLLLLWKFFALLPLDPKKLFHFHKHCATTLSGRYMDTTSWHSLLDVTELIEFQAYVSAMCQVNEKVEISTSHSSHIFQPILMKLEIKKDIRDSPHGNNPTCKIWLMWDDGKRVCVVRTFFVTFCVLSILFCILAHAYRSHQKTDHDRLWLKTRDFAQGRAFWESRWWKIMFECQNSPKTWFLRPKQAF